MTRANPLLQVNDLAVSFSSRESREGTIAPIAALSGVSFTIYPRQTLALVGESGCGKSVTALALMRLIASPAGRVERGSAIMNGRDLLQLDDKQMLEVRGREIAMIFQEPMTSLNPVFTVGQQIIEAVLLHQDMSRCAAANAAVASMSEVGIPEARARFNAYPHQFSGGMRQRIMIAMAVACQPKLLLADEPTTALDVTIQAQILDLLRSLRSQRGMSMMLITHDLGVVAQNADVVCVMYAGRIVEYASVFDLFAKPLHPYTQALLQCRPSLSERRARLTTVNDVMSRSLDAKGIHRGMTAWWPQRNEDAAQDSAVIDTYRLLEIQPEHWIACSCAEQMPGASYRAPDVPFCRSDVTVIAKPRPAKIGSS